MKSVTEDARLVGQNVPMSVPLVGSQERIEPPQKVGGILTSNIGQPASCVLENVTQRVRKLQRYSGQ